MSSAAVSKIASSAGLEGSIDLTDFLREAVEGPATFECLQQGGSVNDCKFKEPQLDWMVRSIFGGREYPIGLSIRRMSLPHRSARVSATCQGHQHSPDRRRHCWLLPVRCGCNPDNMVPFPPPVQVRTYPPR